MADCRSRAALISAISLLTTGCGGALDPVGPVGAQEKQILINGTVAPGLFDAIVANRKGQFDLPQSAQQAERASAKPAGG